MYKHFYSVFPYAVSTRKQRERERERGRVNLTNMPINLLLEYETKKRKHWKIIPFLERFPRTIRGKGISFDVNQPFECSIKPVDEQLRINKDETFSSHSRSIMVIIFIDAKYIRVYTAHRCLDLSIHRLSSSSYLGTLTTMPNDSTSILINFNYDLLIRSIHCAPHPGDQDRIDSID